MIVSLHGTKITADIAARRLVYTFGDQLNSMGEDEWSWVLDHTKLTAKEGMAIARGIEKHNHRVWKFLRVGNKPL